MTKITQADRDAAAKAFFCKPLLNEKHSDDYRVRAFARHREQAIEALQEQHEAYKQEVSDAVEQAQTKDWDVHPILWRFIIPKPKPDPLVEALCEMDPNNMPNEADAENLREALAKRGLKIVEDV